MMARHLIATALLLLIVAAATRSEEGMAGRNKARQLFEYEIGHWHSRWETLGPDGSVSHVREGSEIFARTLDGTAVELITRVEGRDSWSRAVRFYNDKEQRIVFISVSTAGDYYVMRQDVDTEIVEYGPYVGRDGRETMFRFRITRKTEDEQDVVMEYSFDLGETWSPRVMQYMRRVEG